MRTQGETEFVQKVLEMYITLPDTPDKSNPHDAYVAKAWYDAGITLHEVEQAFLLAQVRRRFRRTSDPPLNRIRALQYFAAILKELSVTPMEDIYYRYLVTKLKSVSNHNS